MITTLKKEVLTASMATNNGGLSAAETQIMDDAYANGRGLKDIQHDLKKAALAQDLDTMPQDDAGKERWWRQWKDITNESYGEYMATWETFPLHMAAGRGREDILVQELQKGAHNINEQDGDGNTALHFAALATQSAAEDVLLNAGADIHASSKFGITPLHSAAWAGNTKGCEKLLAAGANLEAQDVFGRTPLHNAAERGRLETYQALVGRGAKESALTTLGEVPLQLAPSSMAAAIKQQAAGQDLGMGL